MLEFGYGLTSIVGPNGSGKSNLVDATRWVFGEQNPRLLRAQRMEDLVFSGSAGRRPLSLAEVTVVLDNSDAMLGIDFTEVAVTRRMSRDGTSEYFINRVPCRLKDILDLFSDTGAGKESYSIIGQGKIDEVLSVRPEDRRELFEEAAGIVKYRNRKREALKRLDETSEGQVRIKDIIAEVQSGIPGLEAEALRAEKSEELHETLSILEIGREVHRAGVLSKALDERRAEVQGLQQRSDRERARLAELDAEYTSVSVSLSKVEEEATDIAARAHSSEQALDRSESNCAALLNEEHSAKAQMEASARARSEAAERLDSLTGAIAGHQAELAGLKDAAGRASQVVEQANAWASQAEKAWRDVSSELEAARKVMVEHRSLVSEAMSKASAEALLARNAYMESVRVEDERQSLFRESERVSASARDLDEQIIARRGELEAARDSFSRTSTAIEGQKRLHLRLEAELDSVRRKVASAHGRLSTLREARQRLEGYQEGPRRVLAMAREGRLSGVLGSVADVLKVEPGYEKALDAALGGAVQYIVAESWEKAERAIELLKASQSGRATFLPLDTIRSNNLDAREARAVAGEGGAVRAAELVRCDAAFKPVVEHLLGRVVVVPDLTAARSLGRSLGFGLRIATRDGDLVSPGGSMTGGERRGRPGLFGQTAELERAEQDAQDLDRKTGEAERAYREASSELRAREEKKIEAAGIARDLERECEDITRQVRAFLASQASLDRRIRDLGQRQAAFGDESLAHAARARDAGSRAFSSQDALVVAEARATSLEAKAREGDAGRTGALANLAGAREELARSQQAELAAMRRCAEATSEQQRLSVALELRQQELAQVQSRLEEIESSLSGAQRERDLMRSIKAHAQQELDQKRAERDSVSSRLSSIERSMRATSRALDNITVRLVEQAKEETRLETSLASLEEGLKSRFSLALAVARAGYAALDEAVEPRISELRDQISALGPTNPQAPAELQRARQRLLFLESQNADLDKAQQQLRQIIAGMDQKMREVFTSSFAQIRENFRQVFRELFGGGEADLWLEDPANVLLSGIEISARPPGRSSQVLSLLSGGERCLVAIALLFAMQRLHPSPFCVLDEIEAPLDEANVERFCVFLKGLASQSQYILITHQKRTMEISDVLYGLTMQETGVSATLSVKLADGFPN